MSHKTLATTVDYPVLLREIKARIQQAQTRAEYALRGVSKPIGISEYELTRALPPGLVSALPTVEEIEAELADSAMSAPEKPRLERTRKTPKRPKKPAKKRPEK